MERVKIDVQSAAIGGVGGLAGGLLVGWLAASAVARKKRAAELDALREHYDGRLEKLHREVRTLKSDRDNEARLYERLADQYRAELKLKSDDRSDQDDQRPPGSLAEQIADQYRKEVSGDQPAVYLHLDGSEELAGDEGDPDDLPGHDSDGNVLGVPAVGLEGPEHEGGEDEGEPDDGWPGAEAVETTEILGPPVDDFAGGIRVDTSKPYEITYEAFGELVNEEGFDTMHLTYYAGDNVLADSRDQLIPNVLMTTGPLSRESFGKLSGDDRLLYVRNHKLRHDFEVMLHDGSFTEIVAGMQDERSP